MSGLQPNVVRLRWCRLLAAAATLISAMPAAQADPLAEPAVFASSNGLLDLLMIARPKPVSAIQFVPRNSGAAINPVAWIYEVCKRPPSGNQCPADSTTAADYGGVRLKLKAGDTLKIRLVNRLPALDKAKVKHATEPGMSNLPRNPTNLHTHGLIVPPRTPTMQDPTFGDYVFLELYNPANGTPEPTPTPTAHGHGEIKLDFVDYRIDIPADHPSGLFWFHPHIHGLSLNQVSAGMAGIITIGDVGDYIEAPPSTVRHLILRDMQVLAAGTLQYDSGPVTVTDGEVQNQQIADFCEQRDTGGPNARLGFCEGEPDEHGTGNSFIGSRWYFTVNGQVFPTIRVASSAGEIWRLTNASAQFTYLLNLADDHSGKSIAMQLLAVDGVSITVPPGTPANTVMKIAANRFTIVNCPTGANAGSVCVKDLTMMPSSRAEIWVSYRNANGEVVAPPAGATATLKQGVVNLGPAGEAWPSFKLARIEFGNPASDKNTLTVKATEMPTARAMVRPAAMAQAAAPATSRCPPLASGHRRRIFFGMVDPTDENSQFGLGYEEVDQNGAVVAGTQKNVAAFDSNNDAVCLPLGPGSSPVHETWELVNLATEVHNFHMHQTKFRVLEASGLAGTSAPPAATGAAVILEDNVPLPFASSSIPQVIEEQQNGYCTIAQWRDGTCVAPRIVLDIPFSQPGTFVFHCHILEHEDNGMMARISVVGP
ncbi:multicopper oxidase family protein [Bradyrhizobium sp. Arg816]|uniref:multicopper oxidase family protein n=1 Tax=Bradyrhizobium sp. Arg816 TaxID=2998491 RepID=UPI00249F66B2|nr:multicopper oxidase domain-containing protein [Bradyrhizobium sp. Arg816]MDI3565672.1 multicopper oxidase domain-containing protein [Bradyrhizobium sp. Arg816]